MSRHDFQIPVSFKHRVVFTRDAFCPENHALAEILAEGGGRRALVVIEENVAAAWPELEEEIRRYFSGLPAGLRAIGKFPGGERAKADHRLVGEIRALIHEHGIDRHSYLLAIGGGGFLDAAGYAAATAHRGVRLVRFPTTTLSQDDSGVGVKCGVNGFGKKNWTGAFAVPFAVINDFRFLATQPAESARAGLIEAVKVAAVKDPEFFRWIERNVGRLAALEPEVLETCVEKSALLHAEHIASGGDAFEMGSSRPLDFGHWAAHKLEAMSGCTVPHADAVAAGIALDVIYARRVDIASGAAAERLLVVIAALGLRVWHEELERRDAAGRLEVFSGADDFREHLGGDLTVLMLEDIGRVRDVHELDEAIVGEAIAELKSRWAGAAPIR